MFNDSKWTVLLFLHLLVLHLPQTRMSSWSCSVQRVWFDSVGLVYILQKWHGNLTQSFTFIKNAPSEKHPFNVILSHLRTVWATYFRAAAEHCKQESRSGGSVQCGCLLLWGTRIGKGQPIKMQLKSCLVRNHELLKSRFYYSFLNYSFQLLVAACAPSLRC